METEESTPTEPGETRKKAGLTPKEYQRRLVMVTAIVLTLGITGGTCLGMKIEKAERIQQQAQATQDSAPETPSERIDE